MYATPLYLTKHSLGSQLTGYAARDMSPTNRYRLNTRPGRRGMYIAEKEVLFDTLMLRNHFFLALANGTLSGTTQAPSNRQTNRPGV